jgi:hypothetical protein
LRGLHLEQCRDASGVREYRRVTWATFAAADLTGARFRDCDLRRVKIADSWLVDVNVSGIVENCIVNDVDVSAFVEAELDRRHPERSELRQMETSDDYRSMWATIERLWSETVSRAERLPESVCHERVDGEWSFVETLRHLVFATDSWVGRTILGEPFALPPARPSSLLVSTRRR